MVCVLLGHGFEESEAIVPIDLLRRAEVEVSLTSLEGDSVTGSHGIVVKADSALSQIDPDSVELVFLPGGLGGVKALSTDPRVSQLVRHVLDRRQGRLGGRDLRRPHPSGPLGTVGGETGGLLPRYGR